MAVQVRWSAEALRTLQDILAYIRQDSPANAEKVFLRIKQKVFRLETFPRIGHPVEEARDTDVREIVVYKFRIIYRILGDKVEIVTVIHGARQIPPDRLKDF